jgi:2-hydroxy-3-oxopropionate reductase
MVYTMRQSGRYAAAEVEVGMIGLGVMGRPMAANLLAKAGGVHVHHRSPDRVGDLLASGAHWAETPRELASRSRVIILVLPDLPQVDEVLDGPDGILAGISRPTVLVISSTSSAAGVRALAERVGIATGGLLSVVDAPVSGGEDGAIAGTLSIMVGGSDAEVELALPALRTMGNPVHLGPLGAGEIAKFCNQLIVASTIMALGEAAVLAERSGIDLDALFSLLEGGYAGSRVLETRRERIVSGDFGSSGVARFMVKDLGFALEEAERTGTTAPQLEQLAGSFRDLVARGFGDRDISVTRAYVDSLGSARGA